MPLRPPYPHLFLPLTACTMPLHSLFLPGARAPAHYTHAAGVLCSLCLSAQQEQAVLALFAASSSLWGQKPAGARNRAACVVRWRSGDARAFQLRCRQPWLRQGVAPDKGHNQHRRLCGSPGLGGGGLGGGGLAEEVRVVLGSLRH